mmetsp:Transcript_12181/g.42756  ORF Transcript_12181/g.42756 Transcript_12181/m.42756 type:complete len:237 (-) Transcript_12181:938-1648(-)
MMTGTAANRMKANTTRLTSRNVAESPLLAIDAASTAAEMSLTVALSAVASPPCCAVSVMSASASAMTSAEPREPALSAATSDSAAELNSVVDSVSDVGSDCPVSITSCESAPRRASVTTSGTLPTTCTRMSALCVDCMWRARLAMCEGAVAASKSPAAMSCAAEASQSIDTCCTIVAPRVPADARMPPVNDDVNTPYAAAETTIQTTAATRPARRTAGPRASFASEAITRALRLRK